MKTKKRQFVTIITTLVICLCSATDIFSQTIIGYLSSSRANEASELCILGFYQKDYKELQRLRVLADKGKSNEKASDGKYQTSHTVFFCEYEEQQLNGKIPTSYGFSAYLNLNGKDIKFRTLKKIKLENPDTAILPNDVWLKDKNGNKLHYTSSNDVMTLTLIYNKKTVVLKLSEENLGG